MYVQRMLNHGIFQGSILLQQFQKVLTYKYIGQVLTAWIKFAGS